ncbi:hypothetical protein P879_01074 [Paragonimus westermani]|uniref:Uncharacterized protein n=1 Tax=Paragonimus westermani TaxID=34504 RepID=A0A8T0DQB5_9TREM|nr:hypothetical protein P879_01074 [Paragonimus westermani]
MNVVKKGGINRERIRNKQRNHRDHHRPRSNKEIPMRIEEDSATVAGPKMSYVAFEPPMYFPKSEIRRCVCCWNRSGVVQLKRKHKRQMRDVKHEKHCGEFIDEVDEDVYSDEHDGSLNLGADCLEEQPTEINDVEVVNIERTSSKSSVTDGDSWVFVEFPDITSSSRGD